MFMRGGMENYLGTEIGENTMNSGLIADIRDNQLKWQGRKILP